MLKLVHVSDLHFAATSSRSGFITAFANRKANELNGCHSQDIADIAAYFISKQLADHDCVLVSGDLATRGTSSDLRLAHEYVLSPATSVGGYLSGRNKPTLTFGSRPIMLVPGNHDRFKGKLGEPGSELFDEVFAAQWTVGIGGVQPVTITTRTRIDISVVAVDFCLEDYASASAIGGHFGQGRCLEKVIYELKRITLAIRRAFPERGVIWVSHFPPSTDKFAVNVTQELIDGRMLLEAAEECEVEYILCGHLHEQVMLEYGNVTVFVAGSLCKWPSEGGNWIHSLNFTTVGRRVKLVGLQNYLFSDKLKDFELDEESSF